MGAAVLDINKKYEQQDNMLYEAVERLKKGDNAAFTNVYKLSQKYLYSILYSIVNNDETVADLLQDTYFIIYKNIKTLKETRSFLKWAGCIATREAYRHLRKYKKEVLLNEEDDEVSVFENIQEEKEEFLPEELLINNEKKRLIFNIIDNLSDEQKITVQYFYYADMSVSEIAEEMECSPGTVKSRLNYARKQIKEAVLDLEKKHKTKLYGTAVPVLWLMFREKAEAAELPKALSEDVLNSLNKALMTEGASILKEASNKASVAKEVLEKNEVNKVVKVSTAKDTSKVNNISKKTGDINGLKKFLKTSAGKATVIGSAVTIPAVAVFIAAYSMKAKTSESSYEDDKLYRSEYSDIEENMPLASEENLQVTKEETENNYTAFTVMELYNTGFLRNYVNKDDFYYYENLIKDRYILIERDNLEGLIDIEGCMITECKWDDITVDDTTGPLIKVRSDGKEGYLNEMGELITGRLWDEVKSVTQDNTFIVGDFEEQKYYYYDIYGNMITNSGYDVAGSFTNGIATARINSKWGAIDKKGNVIIDFIWDDLLYEGDDPYILAVTTDYREEYRTYCFDLQGREVFKLKSPYQAARGYNDGVAVITGGAFSTDYYNYIDTEGNILFKHSSMAEPYVDGAAVIYDYWDSGDHMLIDKYGNRITGDKYTDIYHIVDKTAIVLLDEKYGVIRTDGTYIIRPEYDHINRAGDMKAFVCTKDDLVTVIDYSGNTLIEAAEGEISVEAGNMYKLEKENNEILFFNSEGQLLFTADGSGDYDISGYDDGHILRKYYDYSEIIDKDGNLVLTCEGECYLLKKGYFVQIYNDNLYLKRYEN